MFFNTYLYYYTILLYLLIGIDSIVFGAMSGTRNSNETFFVLIWIPLILI